MTILSIQTEFAGQENILPRRAKMVCNDTLAQITFAGYLNGAVNNGGNPLNTGDFVDALYGPLANTPTELIVSIVSGVVTASVYNPDAGGVTTPGNFANYANTTGKLDDLGFSPTNSAKTKVVMLNAAPTLGNAVKFTAADGTIGDAGFSGIPGGIYGCTQTWASTSGTTMSAGTVFVLNSGKWVPLVYASPITLSTLTTGINKLSTGTIAMNTQYYIIAWGDSTGVNAPGWTYDVSATAPTAPTGYNIWRVVGCEKTAVGSEALLKYNFQGNGNRRNIQWVDLTNASDFIVYNDNGTAVNNISLAHGCPTSVGTLVSNLVDLRADYTETVAASVLNIFPHGITYAPFKVYGQFLGSPISGYINNFNTAGTNAIDFTATTTTSLVITVLGFTFDI